MMEETRPSHDVLSRQRIARANTIAEAGSLSAARQQGLLERFAGLTLSEALVLGLLQQGVENYFVVFGHGSTEMGEVLRIYYEAGLIKVLGLRSEIEASHAAAALRWVTGEKSAVVTSIGPGALQALAASLVPASNGLGVWYLLGDETTEDEGFNMQQIPKHEQNLFYQMASTFSKAYSLHTPLSLPTALQRGAAIVDHPNKAGPFYLLLPMNTQAAWMPGFNLDELPKPNHLQLGPAEGDYHQAADWICHAQKVLIKVGGGGRNAEPQLSKLLTLSQGVMVHTPIATGCIPYNHPQNMGVGGSKGTLCGNYAMDHADLLIAIGTRSVCQSDSSRTGYPNVKRVINVNADVNDVLHYNHTLAFLGDIQKSIELLNQALQDWELKDKSSWLEACRQKKAEWGKFKAERFKNQTLYDKYWNASVLTQPAAIKIATDWAKANNAVCFFDAGDVQANGFQIVEDDRPDQTFTDTGASYMGFAVSAVLATAVSAQPFYGLAITGDGSFTMNPQILIDGAEYGAQGCILILDNGRMSAITGLQEAQYQVPFATESRIQVNYVSWGKSVPGVLALHGGYSPESLQTALEEAGQHAGLSLIHVPVYYGPDPLGGMGVYGRWNVGNWCEETQALRHQIGL